MENINSILKNYQEKGIPNPGPKSFVGFLVSDAVEKLNAQGHERWITKCFKKNRFVAAHSLALALETPREKITNCPAALFTWWFKRLIIK